ncbi:hypothetical protein, partial [Salmonella enterica]|uniref:hypothetical protein n=1 Tax=Salmonella enterica TaxID=28901 RepID=UPI0007A90C74
MKKNKFKGNTLYLTLIYSPDGRVEKLEKRKKRIKEKKDDNHIHVKRMNEMIYTFSGALDKFTCK